MSDFISKPPHHPSDKANRPKTFEGGMMPVPDVIGLFIVDLRSLQLDEKQSEAIDRAIQKTVMEHLGKMRAPEKGLTRLGGRLAGIAIQDV